MYLQRHSLNRTNKPFSLQMKDREELGSGITHVPYGSISRRKTTHNPQFTRHSSYQRTSAWISRQSISSLPPQSPPPLSPTKLYQKTTCSISSSDDDNDDDEPLSNLCNVLNVSLLSDDEEEGDDELVPIACLNGTPLVSAAEKYKAKVKAKLQLN